MIEKIRIFYEQNTINKIVVLTAIAIPFVCFGFFILNVKQQQKIVITHDEPLVIYETDTSFQEKKTGYYDHLEKKKKIEKTDAFFDYSKSITDVKKNLAASIQESTTSDSVYFETPSINNKSAITESLKRTENQINLTNNNNNRGAQRTITKQKKHLSYHEKLLIEKQRRLQENRFDQVKKTPNDIDSPSFEAAIYDDQWLIPGERLKLILPQNIVINGRHFAKGTPLYAMVTIQESRVFLDIENIKGEAISYQGYDPNDFRLGLYSQRAGELWKEYQNSIQQNTQDSVLEEVSKNINVPVLGNSISDISGYFKKKKKHKEQQLLFINDHKIILKHPKNSL